MNQHTFDMNMIKNKFVDVENTAIRRLRPHFGVFDDDIKKEGDQEAQCSNTESRTLYRIKAAKTDSRESVNFESLFS